VFHWGGVPERAPLHPIAEDVTTTTPTGTAGIALNWMPSPRGVSDGGTDGGPLATDSSTPAPTAAPTAVSWIHGTDGMIYGTTAEVRWPVGDPGQPLSVPPGSPRTINRRSSGSGGFGGSCLLRSQPGEPPVWTPRGRSERQELRHSGASGYTPEKRRAVGFGKVEKMIGNLLEEEVEEEKEEEEEADAEGKEPPLVSRRWTPVVSRRAPESREKPSLPKEGKEEEEEEEEEEEKMPLIGGRAKASDRGAMK